MRLACDRRAAAAPESGKTKLFQILHSHVVASNRQPMTILKPGEQSGYRFRYQTEVAADLFVGHR